MSEMQKRRRSMLFIPGNNPGMLCNSVVLGADAVIFDLEDAVALREKDAARLLVRNALRFVQPLLAHQNGGKGVEIFVRINALDTDLWRGDVAAVVQGGADGILLPKCDSAADVQQVMAAVHAEESAAGRAPHVQLMALVESALGVERAFEIAQSHPRLCGLLLGAEDLSANLHAKRSKSGEEILYARGRLLNAARAAGAAGVQAIDTPFTDVNDAEGLAADAALACRLGFDGKAVISPHHVQAVNAAFSPTAKELEWAERVLAAEKKALAEGKGVVSLDGKMVDMPVILRARFIAAQNPQCPSHAQPHGQPAAPAAPTSEVCHA